MPKIYGALSLLSYHKQMTCVYSQIKNPRIQIRVLKNERLGSVVENVLSGQE